MEEVSENSEPESKHTPLSVRILNRDRSALIISIISVVVAGISLGVVAYKEFW